MKYEQFVLKNGTPLITTSLPGLSSTTLVVLVKAGPRFDPPDKPGLSHFVEHLFFRGTKHYPTSSVLSTELEKRGAFWLAFSYEEVNKYWIRCPKEAKEKSIEMLLDCLQNPLFSQEEIDQEKEVVREELRSLRSSPEEYIWEVWAQNVWQNTPLGKIYLGTEESITSFTQEDAFSFFKRHYLPQNMVFVASGAIKGRKIAKIFNYFLNESPRKEKLKVSPIVLTRENPIRIVRRELENVTCAYGFLTTGFFNKDKHLLELISTMLAGGWSSSLRQKVMQPGHTYSIESYPHHLSNAGYFMIKFTTTEEKLNKVLAIINQELISLKKGKFSDNELERAKGYFTSQLRVNIETSEDFANWYGEQAILSPKKILDIEDKCRIMREISSGDIQRVAQKYFVPRNWYLSLIGKVKEEAIRVEI